MYKYLVPLFLVAALSGCASVPMGDVRQDTALKTFAAKPGQAGLYIYRNETFGSAVRMEVAVDGQPLGQTAPQTYLYKELPPGRHTVSAKAENQETLTIDMAPGKLYYVWQEVKMGLLYARTQLHLVGEAEGRKGVMDSKLAVGQ